MNFTVEPRANFMSNDVVLRCHCDEYASVNYELRMQAGNVLLYSGSFEIKNDFDLPIYEFFDTLNKVPDLTENIQYKYVVKFYNQNGGALIANKPITIFYGGISKIMKRIFASDSTDIFLKKLFNYRNNFFLTSRTAKNLIYIPENEIERLGYYNNNFSVYLIYENASVYNDALSAPIVLNKSIDIRVIRQQQFNFNNRLPSYFEVKNAVDFLTPPTDWSTVSTICRIVITDAEPTEFFIRFLNSWGCFERIACYEEAKYSPEFTEQEDYVQYDNVIADFTAKQLRKIIKNTYSLQIKCCDSDRRNFVLDMLLSEECYFIAYGRQFSAKVMMESEDSYDRTHAPGNFIKVKLTLNDDELYYNGIEFSENVMPTEITYLVDAAGNNLTDSNGNYLIVS